MMHDGKALQSGTSHYFGDGFARSFEIQFLNREIKLSYPHQTSWGMSTRVIGGIIMVHGDDNGLVLPPKIAPTQLIIIPVQIQKEGVLKKAAEVYDRLKNVVRAKIDTSDKMPGWKFSEYEMKGIPLRLEIGPKDIEKNQCVLVRRDNREKYFISLDNIEQEVLKSLDLIQASLLKTAKEFRQTHIYDVTTLDDMIKTAEEKQGFINAMWCGDLACEEKIKEVAGLSSRCLPFEQKQVDTKCICCGKPAKSMVIWGKSY
jgi:prolyl-tRNA synthetase